MEHKCQWKYNSGDVRCFVCGQPGTTEQLMEQVDALDKAYAEAGPIDMRPDPDDPRTFALNHRGEP